jgi:transcriptional regulator with XRE-family HTH domain
MSYPVPPQLKLWFELSDALAIAAETGVRRLHNAIHRRRQRVGLTRRPGADTPMWNVYCSLLKKELKPYGSKVRLARYLGVPRQRINDFLNGRNRLPDAELTLRMLHWLSVRRSGRDLSL